MTNGTLLSDAEIIVRGIGLGGSADIAAAVRTAELEGPLTPDRIERLAHSDWGPARVEELLTRPVPEGCEQVGLARIYPLVDQRGSDARLLAASGYGWLPGSYATREAALLAYGYVLGGEGSGYLEDLRDKITRGERRPIVADDLVAFARN
ncbi:hypothetical protein GCM10010387_15450 [Streptomyces inusitatus]|uniref:Uncharacterized protein n=1 Tax=Streptomyces inusitatus TaxID=68221 RepID=A0A918UNR7_9ACTN|nr:hypothetical protein [Streptomyces inusitatus]GGZ23247.1 hypothetical protein GCM10010387_15450 [Streptomyces inusitatus]